MDPLAFYGPLGDYVKAIAPETEADPVAILTQGLTSFGSMVGGGPYYAIGEADKHRANLFTLIVGDTGEGRKGLALGQVQSTLGLVNPIWFTKCIENSLASGEGVIHRVRDRITERVPNTSEDKVVDAGVDDKRVLVITREFSSVLKQFAREGAILSSILRDAWDSSPLENMTRKNPERATGAYISIIAHIPEAELIRYLDTTEAVNGLVNRFLIFNVNRTRFLPNGGNVNPEVHEQLRRACRAALRYQKKRAGDDKRMMLSADAFEAYRELYGEGQRRGILSSQGEGLFGLMITGGPAHVLRLSLIFAILDCSYKIELPHLAAAVAVLDGSVRSTFQIFGDTLGEGDADTILAALRSPEGMRGISRTDISKLFSLNLPKGRIDTALASLRDKGLATFEKVKTAGAPREVWTATEKPSVTTPDYLEMFRDNKEWKAKLERSTSELRKRQKMAMDSELGERPKKAYAR